jgi:hypothetical protein
MSDRLQVVPGNQEAPDRTSAERFQDDAIEFWQARSTRQLSREDARQIIENLTGFFRLLESWQKASQATSTVDTDWEKRAA